MEEVWKDIEEYEGLYQVSNLGRVRSVDRIDSRGHRRKGNLMKQTANKNRYMVVGLSRGNHHVKYLVHRLVAVAFLDNPEKYPIINHKDENPHNNNVINLEWCTHLYNTNYGHAKEKAIANRNYDYSKTNYALIGKKNSKPIIARDLVGNIVQEFPSLSSVNEYGYTQSSVSLVLKGRKNMYRNMIWEYKQDENVLNV